MGATLPGAAAPPRAGSLHWYAWLFTPESSRPLTAAIFALETELRSIIAARVDHGISHLKLQWWKEEIQRLEQGVARHPLTQALWRARPDAARAWRPLQDAVSGIELELACASYETEPELEAYFARADGFCRALALALGGDRNPLQLERLSRATGQSIRMVEVIRDLRQDAIDGRIHLPLAWLSDQGISHVELRAVDGGEGTRRCLERLAARSRHHWQAAMAEFAQAALPELRGLRVFGALHGVLLDRIESRRFAVGRKRMSIGPSESLWTAWRAARQHGTHG